MISNRIVHFTPYFARERHGSCVAKQFSCLIRSPLQKHAIRTGRAAGGTQLWSGGQGGDWAGARDGVEAMEAWKEPDCSCGRLGCNIGSFVEYAGVT